MDHHELASCWQDFTDVVAAGIPNILLYGPPGTGKTFAAMRCGVTDGDVERLVCTEDLTSGEITGTWLPAKGGLFEWREGPAIRAWRGRDGNGTRLVVDEIDRASGDALSTLLAVTDSIESAAWKNPDTLEVVRPGPKFSVIMTSNVDDVTDIPLALRDRFPVALRIDQPHRDALAQLSEDLRGPAAQGSLGPPERRVSLRTFYAFDLLRSRYGSERAAQLVFGDEHADAVLDVLTIGAIA
jgi:MoxR-like ATPase